MLKFITLLINFQFSIDLLCFWGLLYLIIGMICQSIKSKKFTTIYGVGKNNLIWMAGKLLTFLKKCGVF